MLVGDASLSAHALNCRCIYTYTWCVLQSERCRKCHRWPDYCIRIHPWTSIWKHADLDIMTRLQGTQKARRCCDIQTPNQFAAEACQPTSWILGFVLASTRSVTRIHTVYISYIRCACLPTSWIFIHKFPNCAVFSCRYCVCTVCFGTKKILKPFRTHLLKQHSVNCSCDCVSCASGTCRPSIVDLNWIQSHLLRGSERQK